MKLGASALVCEKQFGVIGSSVGLGAAALDAIRFSEGQSATYLQESTGLSSEGTSWVKGSVCLGVKFALPHFSPPLPSGVQI